MEVVLEYAEAMQRGDIFPTIVVFQDEQDQVHLADGWYRVMAAKHAGLAEIFAEARFGSISGCSSLCGRGE